MIAAARGVIVAVVLFFGVEAVICGAVEPGRTLVGRLDAVEQLFIALARREVFLGALAVAGAHLVQHEVLVGAEREQDVIYEAVRPVFGGIKDEGSIGYVVHGRDKVALRGDLLLAELCVVGVFERLFLHRVRHVEAERGGELGDQLLFELRPALDGVIGKGVHVGHVALVLFDEVVGAQRVDKARIRPGAGVHGGAFQGLVFAAFGDAVEAGIYVVIDDLLPVFGAGRIIGLRHRIRARGYGAVGRRIGGLVFRLRRDDALFIGIDGLVDGHADDIFGVVDLLFGEKILEARVGGLRGILCRDRRQVAAEADLFVHAQPVGAGNFGIAGGRADVVAVDDHFALAQVIQRRELRHHLAVCQRIEQQLEGIGIRIARRNVAVAVGDEVGDEVALVDLVGGEDVVDGGRHLAADGSAHRFKRGGQSLRVAADVDFGDHLFHILPVIGSHEFAAGHQAERKGDRQQDTDQFDDFLLHNRIVQSSLLESQYN